MLLRLTFGGGGGGGRGFSAGVEPGLCLVTLSVGDTKITRSVTVLQDLWVKEK